MLKEHKDRLAALHATVEVEVSGVTSKVEDGNVVPEGTAKYTAVVKDGNGKEIGRGTAKTKAEAYELAITKAESGGKPEPKSPPQPRSTSTR